MTKLRTCKICPLRQRAFAAGWVSLTLVLNGLQKSDSYLRQRLRRHYNHWKNSRYIKVSALPIVAQPTPIYFRS